jgi:hypothetical protein
VPLGDDFDGAVDDVDGGLIVDRIRRPRQAATTSLTSSGVIPEHWRSPGSLLLLSPVYTRGVSPDEFYDAVLAFLVSSSRAVPDRTFATFKSDFGAIPKPAAY